MIKLSFKFKRDDVSFMFYKLKLFKVFIRFIIVKKTRSWQYVMLK